MENVLPKRKHPRLKGFNYESNGAYFLTICTQNRRNVLSKIVGRGLAPAEVVLTKYGEIAREQLFEIEKRFPNASVDFYVIMPNHIHIVLLIDNSAGASPRPTVMDIICAYKSLTTKACREEGFKGKLFQTSFHDHIIRNREEYEEISKYIYENPINWQDDELYIE
ncbi:MAG: transposase [Clostridia bacterium]|nr:transposase [Clostridia bacterium]